MRGVFVLFEGLPSTVIDSQVLAHVRLVRETLGIDFTIVAVACTREIFDDSCKRLEQARKAAGCDVHLIRGVRPAWPGSRQINRRLLGLAIARIDAVSFIHARTDYAAAVVGPWARRRGIPTLWDCRGDSMAEMLERLGGRSSWLLRYQSLRLRNDLRLAGGSCSAACFVTPQLRGVVEGNMAGQPSWVIPCLAPEAEFFFSPALRDRVRAELAISPDEAVYVYSGSLVAYQCFDETVSVFRAVLAAGRKARLIVLTRDVKRAQKICADVPAPLVLCKSVPHTEVNGYLNAADFGMLLRESTPVNVAAFPTKFAEYAMTGLKVMMKSAPPSCVAAAREFGNYLPLHAKAEIWSAVDRAQCAQMAGQRLGRLAAMPTYLEIYQYLAQTGHQARLAPAGVTT